MAYSKRKRIAAFVLAASFLVNTMAPLGREGYVYAQEELEIDTESLEGVDVENANDDTVENVNEAMEETDGYEENTEDIGKEEVVTETEVAHPETETQIIESAPIETIETIETETDKNEPSEAEPIETETVEVVETIVEDSPLLAQIRVADSIVGTSTTNEIIITGFEQSGEKLTYTGTKITQDIKVYYKGKQLKEQTDYTITYKNNINAANYRSSNAPSVTVTMKGLFAGSKTMYFTIAKRNIDEGGTNGYEQVLQYSENLKLVAPTVYYNNKKLTSGKDFECDYGKLPENYTKGASYELGKTYEYTVKGINNFTGSFTMSLTVTNDKQLDFGNATVTLDKKQFEYHDEPLTKDDIKILSVKVGSTTLSSEYFDYKVSADNIGTGYVEVYPSEQGRSKGYRGTKKISIKVVGDRKISMAALGEDWKSEVVFSQAKLDKEGGIFQSGTKLIYYKNSGKNEYLVEGTDYTVQYKNNTKVGNVTVTFTGKGRYSGVLKKTYKIVPNTKLEINWKSLDSEGNPIAFYVKGGVSTEFDLVDNTDGTYVLKNKTDYSFSVKYNKITGKATYSITGKGNYKGYSQSGSLEVVSGDISKATVTVMDKLFSTKEGAWKSTVTVKDVNGAKLTAGQDYDSNIEYTYDGMEKGGVPATGTIVYVTIKGINNYEGSSVTAQYHIYSTSISKLTFVIASKEYTGEEITLTEKDIHAYLSKADAILGNEIKENCYEIVGYINNIKTGTAKVILKGVGSYGGTKTFSFKINPKEYVELEEDTTPTGEYVTPQLFKKDGDVDDTASFNRAIESLGDNCKTLYVPEGEYNIDASVKVKLKSNMSLVMSNNAKIKAIGNSSTGYDIIYLKEVNNVTITGGQIIGERYNHSGSNGEWGMGIGVYDSNNITISGVTVSDCWGDGIYLGSDEEQNSLAASSKNITIKNCTLKNNRRNNLSIVCADYVTIDNCSFDNANGTEPGYGICIETNVDKNPNEHITISNSIFNDNAVAAFGITSPSNDIALKDCIFNGNVINYTGTNVSFSNCTINGNLYARAGVEFDSDTVINNGTSTKDKLVASFSANQGDFSLYEMNVDSSNQMSASVISDSDSSCKKAVKLERTSEGTQNAGYYLKLSEITKGKMSSLKTNSTYRFEYVVKGTGNWSFHASQSSPYGCVPMSDKFSTGIITYKASSGGECNLIFYATDVTEGMYLEIESIKIYEVN